MITAMRGWVMATLLAGCSTTPAAAACPYQLTPIYTPPAKYDGLPLPAGVKIVHMPLSRLQAAAAAAGLGPNILAVSSLDGTVVILPDPDDVPAGCYAIYRNHEIAHLHGWKHQ